MPQKIFVIYGRDEAAHRELSRFISSLGLEELSFDSIGNSLGASPFIADIVVEGVSRADAVIALFTPDEQAALYSPEGVLVREAQSARWQSRPNVIFEAGLAYGLNRNKTILVTLGTDVTLFSDVSGIHFVKLGDAQGKTQLRNRLAQIVDVATEPAGWPEPAVSGDFGAALRSRWRHYDELDSLERHMRETLIGDNEISLVWILRSVAQDALRGGRVVPAESFMKTVHELFGNSLAEKTYWELIIAGFLEFDNPDDWWGEKDTWSHSVQYARIAGRGAMLLSKLSKVVDESLKLETDLFPRHKEVDDLIKAALYPAALDLNSKILKEHPDSARAHFNQARAGAQMSLQSARESESRLLAARRDLVTALELGMIKLNVLMGFPKERRKPLDIIRKDPDLAPVFQRWPDIQKQLGKPHHIQQRTGGGGCVGANMGIELPGNRIKSAADVLVGDAVMAWDSEQLSKVEARVTAVRRLVSADILVVNGMHWFTAVHPLLTSKGWVHAGAMTVGAHLCLGTGAVETVLSIEKPDLRCQVVDITVEPYSTFIAGGVVVHNKKP